MFDIPQMRQQYGELLSRLELLEESMLNCCQLVINLDAIAFNHFLAPFVKITKNTLYLAISDTKFSSMRLLKWSKWSWGSEFPSYTLIVGSLNPSSNLASCFYQLKGDPIATTINSSSFSSMATIARWSSTIRISLCPLALTSCCLLWAVECWDHPGLPFYSVCPLDPPLCLTFWTHSLIRSVLRYDQFVHFECPL